MMHIWLEFPRNTDESSRRQVSVQDLLEAELRGFYSPILPLALIRLTQAFIGVILLLVFGSVVSIGGPLAFFILAAFHVGLDVTRAICFKFAYILIRAWEYFESIFLGLRGTRWNRRPRNSPAGGDSPTNLLYGIWFALRKRACSEPCDKFFGLSGILKQSGAQLATSAHSQSLMEIYRSLMSSLVCWNDEAVTLIVDAGVQNLEQIGWPSWLPNWTLPRENTWLLDQVFSRNSYYTTGPRQRITPPIDIISHNSMRLKGYSKGRITAAYRFMAITNDATHAQQLETLLKMKEWTQDTEVSNIDVAKVVLSPRDYYNGVAPPPEFVTRYIQASLFGILEGLVRDTRSIEYYERTPRNMWIERMPWEAPYDFEDHKQEFTAFLALLKIIERTRDQSDDTFLTKVQNSSAAYEYFVRIVNKMVTEKRCLFKLSSGVLGTGRLEVSVGDEVFLFPSVCAPMAVRQGGEEGRIVIGPVCAPSVMHGENMDGQEQTEVIL
ncbi:hypothetical protein F4825DRAFT_440119, partial [Nemania diffusa]